MREMSSMGEVHPEDLVAWLQGGEVSRHVGLASAVGLHVCMFGVEQRSNPRASQAFHVVHELAAAVVTAAGIPLGILVGENGPRCGQHSGADKVFRRDQLQGFLLALHLILDGAGDFRIDLLDRIELGH